MNTTELKALADRLSEMANCEANETADAMNAAALGLIELIAAHEDAQGEIRALRATEQNLRERLKAVEADRAQRVPDGAISGALFDFAGFLTTLDAPVRFGSTEDAAPMVELLQEFAKKRGLSLDDADVMHWSTKLASTPAPAQQEPGTPMDAHRAAYFMRRFLHEEKMLGPNEQAALHFTIAALEAVESAAQHQEQPQKERGPMTDAEIEDMCGEANRGFCIELEDYKKAVRDTERHHGIKE